MNRVEQTGKGWQPPAADGVRRLGRTFSGQVEDSPRLRLLGLATLWVAALAVGWVGGSTWAWLGGGITATCGHAFSWHRRNRTIAMWPAMMGAMVIGLALVMRSAIGAALEGNWLPLAHLLLLVQAIASFDIRTRGGLYGGFALSGIVLFFASQQAFELSFGLFLLGYVGLLLATLGVAVVEDATKSSSPDMTARSRGLPGFWIGIAAAVTAFSVLAFLLLPRGESNAVGYQDVAALPFTGAEGVTGPGQGLTGQTGAAEGAGRQGQSPSTRESKTGATSGLDTGTPNSPTELAEEAAVLESGRAPVNETRDVAPTPSDEDVVMHVRSPVASYWRGQTFAEYDGRRWYAERARQSISWASARDSDLLRYTQTFYLSQPEASARYTGYGDVEALDRTAGASQSGGGGDSSYKVVSVRPNFVPDALRRDWAAYSESRYRTIPSSMSWLPEMAQRATAGASTDFDRAASIAAFVRWIGRLDVSALDQLQSVTPLEEFLQEERPGTSVDYATATAMLARAAGLPARVVRGYLPGQRDLLSGAYEVREKDAHAWAEVKFREHGWVPFDASPRALQYSGNRASAAGQVPGLRHLFESSVGDDLLRAVVRGPSRLSGGLKDALSSPVSAVIVVVAVTSVLATLAWLAARIVLGRVRAGPIRWSYSRLHGEGRAGMLTAYRRLERQLRRRGMPPRGRGQTVGEYLREASDRLGVAQYQLEWFAEAAWAAAYDSRPFP